MPGQIYENVYGLQLQVKKKSWTSICEEKKSVIQHTHTHTSANRKICMTLIKCNFRFFFLFFIFFFQTHLIDLFGGDLGPKIKVHVQRFLSRTC